MSVRSDCWPERRTIQEVEKDVAAALDFGRRHARLDRREQLEILVRRSDQII
jgi:hypothetical protein